MCTFAGNRLRILRCQVCDSVRGTAWDYFMGGHGQAEAAASQHQQQEAAGSTDSAPAVSEGAPGGAAPAHAGAGSAAVPVGGSASRERSGLQDGAGSSGAGEGGQAGGEGSGHGLDGDEGAAGSSMWGAGDEPGSWLCRRCGETVGEAGKAEHEDYHLALQLQQDQDAAQGGSGLSTPQASQPRKRKAAAKSSQRKGRVKGLQGIDAFLKRANTKCL